MNAAKGNAGATHHVYGGRNLAQLQELLTHLNSVHRVTVSPPETSSGSIQYAHLKHACK